MLSATFVNNVVLESLKEVISLLPSGTMLFWKLEAFQCKVACIQCERLPCLVHRVVTPSTKASSSISVIPLLTFSFIDGSSTIYYDTFLALII